jgi:hypothetical protein
VLGEIMTETNTRVSRSRGKVRLSKYSCSALLLSILCVGTGLAGDAAESVSGLPLPPGFTKTGDPLQSYKFCGKQVHSLTYVADGLDGIDAERAWYAKRIPKAKVFTAVGGVVTFVSEDGTAAVELADAFVSYLRFSPGLTATEMKILGEAPASRECRAS